jgi:AcrR family transcriptional regulator
VVRCQGMSGKQRARLTRDTVIDTALQLLQDVGLDGLTTRRLAAALGVQSPALYWHFHDKQDLLDGMADAIIVAAGMGPPREGESWQDWLTRRARSSRRSLLAHRDSARLVASARQLSPATIRMFDEELTALVTRRFSPVLALRTITAFSHYVTGFVLQEQTESRKGAVEPIQQLASLIEQARDAAPTTLILAIRTGGSPSGEEAFEHGLRALIDGTEAALNRDGPSDHYGPR